LYVPPPAGAVSEVSLAAAVEEVNESAAAPAKQASLTGPAQPFKQQLWECTRKLTLAYWRMPTYNFLRLLMAIACALVSTQHVWRSCLCA
jgi:hypothetical protein